MSEPDRRSRPAADARLRGDAQTALLAAYGLLAFAAVGRSTFELVTKFSEAPVAYSLSAFAAFVYCVATWAIASGTKRAVRIGRVSCAFEMVGVLVVGTITTLNAGEIADTVWSYYGRDYGWLPLVVPALALWWLFKQHPEA